MNQITINTISGASPFSIYVCDTLELNCILSLTNVTTLPLNVPIPPILGSSPAVVIKIVDASGCTQSQVYSCVTPTNTPTPSVTQTPTSSTPPTPSVTPTLTETPISASPTPTQSLTPTNTPTPTITPSTTSQPNIRAVILIEPISASTNLGNYMYNKGLNFLGFSNDTSPSQNQNNFNLEMNNYLDYSGWTNNELLSISIPVANNSIGFDGFNNPKTIYNFLTVILSSSTIQGESWFSVIIPTGLTNGFFQKEIGVSTGSPNFFTDVKTDEMIYSYTFTYTGYNFNRTTYRLYTTFPSTELLLDNTNDAIFMKGNKAGT